MCIGKHPALYIKVFIMKEIWKDIKWYEWMYQVSNLGDIKSLSRYRNLSKWPYKTKSFIMKQSVKNGYNMITLNKNGFKKTYPVHRIVYCVFNNIDYVFKNHKWFVCHKNDIRDDNRLENLFYWTQEDNVVDMMRKGRQRRGKIKKIKIWFEDISKIKEKYQELKSIYKVADCFWVSYATISRALNWKIWNSKGYD